MKTYGLLVDCMLEECNWPITEMFSKGHQPETEFKNVCKEVYAEVCDDNGEEVPTDFSFIDESRLYLKWGKTVGLFEDGKRVGWTLSESKEYKKGYYPLTKINI